MFIDTELSKQMWKSVQLRKEWTTSIFTDKEISPQHHYLKG